jgi:Fe-only nitrogenase accessory protein AnfO
MKIAVMEDSNRNTCSIFDPGWVVAYSDASGEWLEESRFENTVHQAAGIAGIRAALIHTVNQLGGVKILVAAEISGIAFSILEGAGFESFTVAASSADVLNSVKSEMEETAKGQRENARSANIQLYLRRGMNRGDFFLDMQEMLAENPQATTKSVLLPYLREGDFTRLDVVCGHVPPWFDVELGLMGLAYETVNVLPDKKTVRIVHIKNSSEEAPV